MKQAGQQSKGSDTPLESIKSKKKPSAKASNSKQKPIQENESESDNDINAEIDSDQIEQELENFNEAEKRNASHIDPIFFVLNPQQKTNQEDLDKLYEYADENDIPFRQYTLEKLISLIKSDKQKYKQFNNQTLEQKFNMLFADQLQRKRISKRGQNARLYFKSERYKMENLQKTEFLNLKSADKALNLYESQLQTNYEIENLKMQLDSITSGLQYNAIPRLSYQEQKLNNFDSDLTRLFNTTNNFVTKQDLAEQFLVNKNITSSNEYNRIETSPSILKQDLNQQENFASAIQQQLNDQNIKIQNCENALMLNPINQSKISVIQEQSEITYKTVNQIQTQFNSKITKLENDQIEIKLNQSNFNEQLSTLKTGFNNLSDNQQQDLIVTSIQDQIKTIKEENNLQITNLNSKITDIGNTLKSNYDGQIKINEDINQKLLNNNDDISKLKDQQSKFNMELCLQLITDSIGKYSQENNERLNQLQEFINKKFEQQEKDLQLSQQIPMNKFLNDSSEIDKTNPAAQNSGFQSTKGGYQAQTTTGSRIQQIITAQNEKALSRTAFVPQSANNQTGFSFMH